MFTKRAGLIFFLIYLLSIQFYLPGVSAEEKAPESYDYIFEKDNQDRLKKITNPDGSITTYHYNENNKLERVEDSKTGKIRYEYKNNLISKLVYPSGQEFSFEYYGNGNVKKTHYPDGTTVSYEYVHNDLISAIHSDFGNLTYNYDKLKKLESVVDAEGNKYSFNYDKEGYFSDITYPSGDTVPEIRVAYKWSEMGKLKKITSPFEFSFYSYDKKLRLSATMDYLGTKTFFIYDTNNIIPKYSISLFEYIDYDANGNPEHSISVDGIRTQWKWKDKNYIENISNPIVGTQTLGASSSITTTWKQVNSATYMRSTKQAKLTSTKLPSKIKITAFPTSNSINNTPNTHTKQFFNKLAMGGNKFGSAIVKYQLSPLAQKHQSTIAELGLSALTKGKSYSNRVTWMGKGIGISTGYIALFSQFKPSHRKFNNPEFLRENLLYASESAIGIAVKLAESTKGNTYINRASLLEKGIQTTAGYLRINAKYQPHQRKFSNPEYLQETLLHTSQSAFGIAMSKFGTLGTMASMAYNEFSSATVRVSNKILTPAFTHGLKWYNWKKYQKSEIKHGGNPKTFSQFYSPSSTVIKKTWQTREHIRIQGGRTQIASVTSYNSQISGQKPSQYTISRQTTIKPPPIPKVMTQSKSINQKLPPQTSKYKQSAYTATKIPAPQGLSKYQKQSMSTPQTFKAPSNYSAPRIPAPQGVSKYQPPSMAQTKYSQPPMGTYVLASAAPIRSRGGIYLTTTLDYSADKIGILSEMDTAIAENIANTKNESSEIEIDGKNYQLARIPFANKTPNEKLPLLKKASRFLRKGNFVYKELDFCIEETENLCVGFYRFYNSFRVQESEFGYGWTPFPYALKPGTSKSEILLHDNINGKEFNYVLSDYQIENQENIIFYETSHELAPILGITNNSNYVVIDKTEGIMFAFDLAGKLVSQEMGNITLTYLYDENRLSAIKSSAEGNEKVIKFNYDRKGRIINAKTEEKILANYTYNPFGDLFSRLLPDKEMAYYYEKFHLLSQIFVESNNEQDIALDYDDNGRILSSNQNGTKIVMQYDDKGKSVKVQGSDNQEIEYKFNNNEEISTIIWPGKRVTVFSYGTDGKLYQTANGSLEFSSNEQKIKFDHVITY